MEVSSSRVRVTLLIQGRINENGLRMIERYRDIYPIVVSTNQMDEETKSKIGDHPNLKIVIYRIPIPLQNVNNIANCYLQTCSIYYGLKEVKTEYVIKFRGDEYFSDIHPLVHRVLESDKMVTGDIFFRKQFDYNQTYLYHTCDHYFGCRTRDLEEAMYHVKRGYEEVRYSQEVEPDLSYQYSLVFEQKMTIGYLIARGERNIPKDTHGAVELLLRYVDMVRAQDLGDETIITANVYGKVYINDYSYYNPNLDIFHLDELKI